MCTEESSDGACKESDRDARVGEREHVSLHRVLVERHQSGANTTRTHTLLCVARAGWRVLRCRGGH